MASAYRKKATQRSGGGIMWHAGSVNGEAGEKKHQSKAARSSVVATRENQNIIS